MKWIKVFAPASIGNIGPGFDVLGMAVAGLGDAVEARRTVRRGVRIVEITGGDGQLTARATLNTAGIAAARVLKVIGAPGGIELRLHKGVPGTGLGSSAASAVAAGYATNRVYGGRLSRAELVLPAAAAERQVSGGKFLDNIGASLFGGVVITHPQEQFVLPVGTLPGVILVIVTPSCRLLTREARKVLPRQVPLDKMTGNLSRACTLVAAVSKGDAQMFGRAISDGIIEPARQRLIPGFTAVKRAALQEGALGCTISGAGATLFSVSDRAARAQRIAGAMARAFHRYGLESIVTITRMDQKGARVIRSSRR